MSGRLERLALFLSLDPMTDPADMRSWTVEGRSLDAEQLRILAGFTLQDAADARALLALDREVSEP